MTHILGLSIAEEEMRERANLITVILENTSNLVLADSQFLWLIEDFNQYIIPLKVFTKTTPGVAVHRVQTDYNLGPMTTRIPPSVSAAVASNAQIAAHSLSDNHYPFGRSFLSMQPYQPDARHQELLTYGRDVGLA